MSTSVLLRINYDRPFLAREKLSALALTIRVTYLFTHLKRGVVVLWTLLYPLSSACTESSLLQVIFRARRCACVRVRAYIYVRAHVHMHAYSSEVYIEILYPHILF